MPCGCVQGERPGVQSFSASGYAASEMEAEAGPCNTDDASISTSSRDSSGGLRGSRRSRSSSADNASLISKKNAFDKPKKTIVSSKKETDLLVCLYALIPVDRRKSSKKLEDTCQDYDSGAHCR